MKWIKTRNISFFLLILSGIFLCLAITYCDILTKVENIHLVLKRNMIRLLMD